MSSPGPRQQWGDITGGMRGKVNVSRELRNIFFRLLQYIGRDGAPSPATGSKAAHKKELTLFLDKAMSL